MLEAIVMIFILKRIRRNSTHINCIALKSGDYIKDVYIEKIGLFYLIVAEEVPPNDECSVRQIIKTYIPYESIAYVKKKSLPLL
ncbi:MAG: hypothetical protein ACD_67C00230G0004 [uncultured bacterium]|nr:MAG: hypothetical protein ACD_67C00230G0004 [uncultured bacterium]